MKRRRKRMTQGEYIHWLKTRDVDAANWDRDKCYAADDLVRRTALSELRKRLPLKVKDRVLRRFVQDICRVHFGAAEVDSLLMHLKCYPAWLEGGQS